MKEPSDGISKALKRLVRRAGLSLLSFLWRQIRWWLWISGFVVASYVAMYLHYMWIGSILLWIAIFVGVGWLFQLFKFEDGGYTSQKSKPHKSPFEEQQKDFEDDMNRYQREQEDGR